MTILASVCFTVAGENDKVDPLTMAFTPLGTDQTSMDKWVGQRQDIYLTATEASTARLTEQDVLLTNPLDNNTEVAGLAGEYLQGTGAAAVSQVMSSKSTASRTTMRAVVPRQRSP